MTPYDYGVGGGSRNVSKRVFDVLKIVIAFNLSAFGELVIWMSPWEKFD